MQPNYLDTVAATAAMEIKTRAFKPASADTTHQKRKPRFPSILKRSTANNLGYLQKKELIAPVNGHNIRIPLSLRKRRGDGTFVRDLTPAGGA
jgi:hypothetical protein